VHGIGLRQEVHDDGMAGFVVSHDLALFGLDHAAAALRPGDDALHCLLEFAHADGLLVAAGGQDRGFIDQIFDVRTGEARRELGQRLQVDVGGQGLALGMNAEDRLAAFDVGPVEHDLAVKATGAQQRRIEHVRPVGGGHDDDIGAGLEAVHFRQDLVERLLALVVPAAQTGAALAADGVDLVHEDDGWRFFLGPVKQVAHTAGAHANEHLHELRAGDAEEGHASLPGDGAGHERLAGAGRADHQHALGNARAKLDELVRLPEELDDLL